MEVFSTFRIIFCVLVIKFVYGTGCRFHGDIAKCVNRNLTEIPRIPGNITQLIVTGNDLGSIANKTFKNVENVGKIWKLILSANRIVNISVDAFQGFTALSELDLSSNKINVNDLKIWLHHISQNYHINHLLMNKMGRYTINEETFSLLNTTPALRLYLEHNGLDQFTTSTLSRLKGLKLLDLDNNNIVDLKLVTMDSLETLRVSRNKLNQLPNFCIGNSSESFTKNLTILYMNLNLISSIHNDTFRCLSTIEKVQLARNIITSCPSYFLSSCHNLTYLDLSSNVGHSVNVYPYAFASNSLEFLKIGFNGNALDIYQSIPDTYSGLPKLEQLKLMYTNMMYMSNQNVSDLFSPLTSLKIFECFKCQLKCKLISVLGNKPNLTRVNLKSNYFQAIDHGIFTTESKITELYLGMNKIAHVSSETLPTSFLNKLSYFDLSQNPFICDCKLVWFIDWLRTANKSRIQYYPKGYTCASPSRWANKRLEEVHFSYLECHPFTIPEWCGLIGGPLVVIIIISGAFIYQNRWNIKHYIYMLRKRREYMPLNGENFTYDAFVAYNKSVVQWVKDVLIPLLEGEYNLKLCVHDRDFPVGGFINDTIVQHMRESRRLILVLSNSFVNSDWCMFELKVAHSMHIEDNVEVIAILIEDIEAKNMNNSMKVLLKTTTYLEWTEDLVGHELFITKLKDAMGVALNH
ncbi:Toll6p [Mactra antiquata]